MTTSNGAQLEVAFITGGGSGIGRATALRLARHGAAIAVFDRDGEAVDAVVGEIEAGGGKALGQVGDVTKAADLETAVSRTTAELGGLDATAACAGIAVMGTAESTTDAEWDRAIAVNLTGVLLTARYAVPAMVADGGGAFVAIASDLGVKASADSIAYIASKHGVVGVIRSLAVDYAAQGIRSNVVCPSTVKTPLIERVFDQFEAEEVKEWERRMPVGRFADPEEVAAAVHHLLSPDASYTNGLVYMLDAGASVGTGM